MSHMAATKKPAPAKKTAKKAPAKKAPAKKVSTASSSGSKPSTARKRAPSKNPEGGLTAEGRRQFAEKEGAHLRPGVQGPADTPDKMKRKGSFLRRHFANPQGPMEHDGKPTRLALSAQAWGEPLPKTDADAKRLADKGSELLEQYHAAQGDRAPASSRKPTGVKGAGRKAAAQTKASAPD